MRIVTLFQYVYFSLSEFFDFRQIFKDLLFDDLDSIFLAFIQIVGLIDSAPVATAYLLGENQILLLEHSVREVDPSIHK